MQANPLMGLLPVLLMVPLVALIVGAAMNLRKNPPLSGLLALLAAGYAVFAVLLVRGLITGG
jgi:hypothetical protein